MSVRLDNLEIRRQLFHALLGFFAVALLKLGFIDKRVILTLLIFGLAISFMCKQIKMPVIHHLLEKFERKGELEKFPGKGALFYLAGIYLSLLFFDKEVAMASIMILALGDSVSHLYGIHFGRVKNPISGTKFLDGTIAGFFAALVGASVFLPFYEAFFAALAAMIAEAIGVKLGSGRVDDNIIIPVVAGCTVWILRRIA